MTDILSDPARLIVLVLMGAAIVLSAMIAGYRIARFMGWDGSYGAVAGVVFGVGGMVVFILSPT